MKKVLLFIFGMIGMVAVWAGIFIYFGLWSFILDFFAKLFKSDDPMGWSGVIAMFVVFLTGGLIYIGVASIIEKIKEKKK